MNTQIHISQLQNHVLKVSNGFSYHKCPWIQWSVLQWSNIEALLLFLPKTKVVQHETIDLAHVSSHLYLLN